MIKITYKSDPNTLINYWIDIDQIKKLKTIERNKKVFYKIKLDEWIEIDEKQFNEILTLKNSLWREQQINSIIDEND